MHVAANVARLIDVWKSPAVDVRKKEWKAIRNDIDCRNTITEANNGNKLSSIDEPYAEVGLTDGRLGRAKYYINNMFVE